MEEKSQKASKNEPQQPSTFARLRASRTFRLWIIGILLVLVAILFVFWTKARVALAIAFIALLAAFGFEVSQNDWDLGKMVETRSFEQSKINRDTKGNLLFDRLGNITTDKTVGKKADEYNCDDFSTQPEAQAFFERVGGTGNDINRLDGNKDGEACESLPKGTRTKPNE